MRIIPSATDTFGGTNVDEREGEEGRLEGGRGVVEESKFASEDEVRLLTFLVVSEGKTVVEVGVDVVVEAESLACKAPLCSAANDVSGTHDCVVG